MISTWDSLDSEADAVALMTGREATDICALLQQAVSTLADGFTSTELEDSDATRVRMGIFSQNLNSLKCGVDLAKRGYYTQSMGLVRGVYENWIAFHYLATFPAEAGNWLAHGKRPPSHGDMLNALGPSFTEHKTDARGWYHALCRFAHTDALVVLPHLGNHEGEACTFFGVTYKPDLFRSCAYTLSLFACIMLREVSLLVPGNSLWLDSCKPMVDALLLFIEKEKTAPTPAHASNAEDEVGKDVRQAT